MIAERRVKGRTLENLDLSVVIPVYKSASTLWELYRRISLTLDNEGISFEIIFVEDNGGDEAWSVIEEMALQDARVRGFQLSRNFGQHAATICGFAQSAGAWVATLDDDLEQIPEHLVALIKKAHEGYDLVYGIYAERSHKTWRNLSSSVARWLFAKAIPSLNYSYTSYRVIKGEIARALIQFDSPFPFIDGYLSWLTNRYASVEVPHGHRLHGQSTYTVRKLITHTTNIFVTFSDLPLRMASWLGITMFTLGGAWMLAILIRYLVGGVSVSGFASIMVAILMFGGVQLLMLGIFGEYIGRMNFKSSKKPLFLIGRRVARTA